MKVPCLMNALPFTRRATSLIHISRKGFASSSVVTPTDPVPTVINFSKGSSSSTNDGTFSFTEEKFGCKDETAPILVFVHGGPGSHRDFRYLTGAFTQFKANDPSMLIPDVYRVDLPGYGKSSRLANQESPSATNLARGVFEGLEQSGILCKNDSETEKNKKKTCIFIGHSLGGHVAKAAAILRPDIVTGVGFIATVCMTPHKGVRPFQVGKLLGQNVNHPILGPSIKNVLDFSYKNLFGFPKSANKEEIAYTQQRVSELKFEEMQQFALKSDIPKFLAYGGKDHIIEKEKFMELESAFKPNHFAISFEEGGHNIQKSHAKEIATAMIEWYHREFRR